MDLKLLMTEVKNEFKRIGLTQIKIQQNTGLSQPFVSKALSGEKDITISSFFKLIEGSGISTKVFMANVFNNILEKKNNIQ